jgi:protein ImuB
MNSHACIYFPAGLAQEKLSALAEACLRFSSQVALRPGSAVFVEVGRSRWLQQRASLEARLQWLGRRYGPCRLALGRHAGEALALARWSAAGGPEALPLDALQDYASPFVDDEDSAAEVAAMAAALRSLGLRSLGDFLALPEKSIGERFGADAALLRERVMGQSGMAWPRFETAPQMQESEEIRSLETMDACFNFEALFFDLKRICDRLCARLRGRALRASKLKLVLLLDLGRGRSRPRELDLSLALPQGSPRELLKIIRERLEDDVRRLPLSSGVAGLRLELLESAPGPGSQSDFFDHHEKELEAWNSLVTRLSQKLGPDQVFLAEMVQRYLPERAWRRMLKEPEPMAELATPIMPERPSRLLPQPMPLLRDGEALLAPGRKRTWHARNWTGPERLSGEWWEENFARDYYRVSTDEGRDLWVYAREGEAQGSLWLQGYFD